MVTGNRGVKVVLKGVHRVRRALAGGGHSLHHYAWRGGPRIEAAPGTPEFIAEFQRLTAGRDTTTRHAGTLQQLINDYQRSPAFTDLAEATREGYARRIRKIETEFGDLPLRAIADPRLRGDMLDWRDRLAAKGAREADYTFSVLARILSWGFDRRRITVNPAERPGRLYRGSRSGIVWTEAQISAFVAAAPAHVALVLQIALWTGQRQGDVLRLTWAAYDGATLRLKQGKTGRHMTIPVASPLRELLKVHKAKAKVAVTICTTSRGRPWTRDGFRSSFAAAAELAQIEGVTFHDLRGTAVSRLAIAGATVPEIATITGHSLRDVETILDRHYFSRDRALGESAISKLEKHTSGTAIVNGAVNGSAEHAEAPPETPAKSVG